MANKRFPNISMSEQTHRQIEKLAKLLKREDPAGTKPSKHRTVAIAVAEAIARREAERQEGGG